MQRDSRKESERGLSESPQTESAGVGHVDIESLLSDIPNKANAVDDDTPGVRLLPEQDAEVLFENTINQLSLDNSFLFEDAMVKNNLSEFLLVLIALREESTHGKALKQDLATLFDTHLSPGTIYPELHALEDTGVLEVQELVQTKRYVIDDETRTTDALRRAMRQHLALGVFLGNALARIEHE